MHVNQQDVKNGWTPLHRAARVAHYGHAPGVAVFELLLQHGADASLKTLEGGVDPATVSVPFLFCSVYSGSADRMSPEGSALRAAAVARRGRAPALKP